MEDRCCYDQKIHLPGDSPDFAMCEGSPKLQLGCPPRRLSPYLWRSGTTKSATAHKRGPADTTKVNRLRGVFGLYAYSMATR